MGDMWVAPTAGASTRWVIRAKLCRGGLAHLGEGDRAQGPDSRHSFGINAREGSLQDKFCAASTWFQQIHRLNIEVDLQSYSRRQPWSDRAAQGRPARPMGPLLIVLGNSEVKIPIERV
jgi:hypothetical protein